MKKLAYVVWQDACAHDEVDRRPFGMEQHSTGFVIKDTKKWIRLGQTCAENGYTTDFIDIPQSWIKKKLVLAKGDLKNKKRKKK